jgi:hypothetical protein
MSRSVSDFPYVVGFHDVEDTKLITAVGAEERDLEALGVKDELDDVEVDLEADTYAEAVFGPRYEEFEQSVRDQGLELSDNLSEFDYEEEIDEIVGENPLILKRFLPVELQERIQQRRVSLPPVRYQDPDAAQNALDARTEAAREEVAKYAAEETEGKLVDYNEIKRNTAVVFAEEYGGLLMAERDAFESEFED